MVMAKEKVKTEEPDKSVPPAEQVVRDDNGRFAKGNKSGVRFPPGQSGNPKGPPKRSTNRWLWYCKYMNMNNKERNELVKDELTGSQQAALIMVEKHIAGESCESEAYTKYTVDREEGRATEHLVIGGEDALTAEECDNVREILRRNWD